MLYTVKVVMVSESNRVEHNVSETGFRQCSKQFYAIMA